MFYCALITREWGRNSSVGTETGNGLDDPGFESRLGRDFSHSSDRPWGPPSLLYNGYRVFPGVKRQRRGADLLPLLVSRSRKRRVIPQPPSGPSGLLRGTFTFTITRNINCENGIWKLRSQNYNIKQKYDSFCNVFLELTYELRFASWQSTLAAIFRC
jgi:hypothetical protein